jgi:hypothetical protein
MKEGSKKQISRKIKWIEFKIECLEFLLLNGGGASTRIADIIPLLIFFPLLVLIFDFPQMQYRIIYRVVLFLLWLFLMIWSRKLYEKLIKSRINKLERQLGNLQKQINN